MPSFDPARPRDRCLALQLEPPPGENGQQPHRAAIRSRHHGRVPCDNEPPSARIRPDPNDDSELAFISTVTTFGTALDITLAELAVEAFLPADAATAAALIED